MQIINQNYKINFGKSRRNQYTSHQIKIMSDMKKAALKNGWCDIYTGEKFSKDNMPTIEHLIPCKSKNEKRVIEMQKKGFQINGLDNIIPVGNLGNSDRGNEAIEKTVLHKPVIFERLLIEMKKYSNYKSDLIDGKDWVKRIIQTLQGELRSIMDVKNIKWY